MPDSVNQLVNLYLPVCLFAGKQRYVLIKKSINKKLTFSDKIKGFM